METISKYIRLKNQLGEYCTESNGFFFAFDKKQFEDGKTAIQKRGWLKEGEKLCRIQGGGFATKRAIDKFFAYSDEISNQIKNDCDAQEIYDYEFNNYESDIAPDGDLEAMKIVLSYFDEDKLNEIKRKRAYYTIAEILTK